MTDLIYIPSVICLAVGFTLAATNMGIDGNDRVCSTGFKLAIGSLVSLLGVIVLEVAFRTTT